MSIRRFIPVATTAVLFIFVGALLPLAPASAQANTNNEQLTTNNVSFDIPAQDLGEALSEFARQSGQELLYAPEAAQGRAGNAVNGEMTRGAAMEQLLSGTGLEFLVTPDGGMMIGEPAAVEAYRNRIQRRNGETIAGNDTTRIGQRRPGIEEIIVTGQKREERIQDVPIAISAFSAEDLEAQKIEGGFDLLKGVPNVTFSKTNFSGYNFQIRGIGTQAVSATTDPGVAVSFNNTTLIVNRLFEQEYLDVQRVEVLRGPQGTLFGRNATGGVVNVISNKPEMGVWSGMLDVEVGNYNTRRLRGHFNLPLGEEWAIRGAYASTKRDGYATNEFDGSAIDGRDLWTGRLSIGWQPTDRFRADFLWERFEEDDDRLRSAKNLCHRDEGPEEIDGVNLTTNPFGGPPSSSQIAVRRAVQQGCLPGSLYSDGAFGVPNGDATPFITVGRVNNGLPFLIGAGVAGIGTSIQGNPGPTLLTDQDVYLNTRQSRDLRTVYSPIDPQYQAKSDIYDFSFEYQWTDSLQLTSHTVYVEDKLFSTQDFGRYEASPGLFSDIGGDDVAPLYADFAPDGEFCDPQLGCSDSFRAQDISQAESAQFNQQFELGSDFAGPWNFHLGANYTRFKTRQDYFFFSNILTALVQTPPFDGAPFFPGISDPCSVTGDRCVSVQDDGLNETAANPYGHNFFLSRNPYELNSVGVFGETYWQAAPTLKVTLGLRFTWDRKKFSPTPSQTLLADYREGLGTIGDLGDLELGPELCFGGPCAIYGNAPGGVGYPADPDIVQTWREPTGRLVVDWAPILPFTEETLVYASYAHGYKGGGANPPSIAPPSGFLIKAAQGALAPPTFKPEYVDAFELGTKNTLFEGMLTLNLTGFYYDYTDYQVSKIVDRAAANENFDAEVWGLELESIFAPTLDWQFNAAIGYLQTEIGDDQRSIDLMDRTQGGGQFHITQILNPEYDPNAEQLARSEYVVATCEYPAGVSMVCEAPEGQAFLAFDRWMVVKPNAAQSSNCVAPTALVREHAVTGGTGAAVLSNMNSFCPAGNLLGGMQTPLDYAAAKDAPNGGAGFFDDVSGNELPNAPHFTVSLGGQYSFNLTRDWRATARLDYYWQGKSYTRIHNTDYDRLKSWSSTNLSFWATDEQTGITVEAYVKNLFNETPITGTFLNADDLALTTNVFTLDPRLIGVSVRKEF